MTQTGTFPGSQTHQIWEYERLIPGGIVAGVDGSCESVAALATAASLARSRHCQLHVVTAIPPFPSYHLIPVVDDGSDSVEELRIGLKNAELREMMNEISPEDDWTSEVAIGRPALRAS